MNTNANSKDPEGKKDNEQKLEHKPHHPPHDIPPHILKEFLELREKVGRLEGKREVLLSLRDQK